MTPAIQLHGVSKWFGDLHALASIDLEVGSDEIVTLIGPSGSGKTTLLRVVAGLEEPTTGSVSVLGEPPESVRHAKRIGMVPQGPALLPWRTVAQNASILMDINRRATPTTAVDVAELLTEVGLADFLDAYPHELSGGMAQRVALVRAFALGAPVLLLDEPFAALDEITRADMRHLLARLCRPRPVAVLFVTHSIAEAVYLGDRVGVLSHRPGTIVSMREVPFERPRRPELEHSAEFFDLVTDLGRDLHQAMEPPS